tara:strand:+ start:525 stop:788 length:264 start_codon:yes stop_codon:yes gene_type:complete
MKIDIENLKKRILYRSQYRGTKEMDKILFAFVSKYINNMEISTLINLEKFLDINDEELYKFYNGTDVNLNFEDDYIVKLFKNFELKE